MENTENNDRQLLIDYAKLHLSSLVPYDDPRHDEKLQDMAERYADSQTAGPIDHMCAGCVHPHDEVTGDCPGNLGLGCIGDWRCCEEIHSVCGGCDSQPSCEKTDCPAIQAHRDECRRHNSNNNTNQN